jgi:hypothetical protein
MNSTKRGLYVVNLGSEDGSRLQVDGTLIYDDWSDHGFITRARVLMNLTGSSSLVYDFYENGVGNQVIFNNLTLVLDNTLTTNTAQNICLSSTGVAISGDTFGSLPSGISLSGTGYQWAYSTSVTGPWSDISGATGATFTPSGLNAPFNAGGTFYLIRKAILSSANNVAPNPYIATNESNVATVNVATTVTWTGTTSTNWNTASNWSCGGVPTNTTNVLIPSTVVSGNFPVISSGAPGFVNNIEIQNNSATTLEVVNNYIEIHGTLTLNGTIDLNGEGQLIQTSGSVINPASVGRIERDQQGVASTYAYNYWGSPVEKIFMPSTSSYSSKLKDILFDGAVNVNFVSGLNGAMSSPISIANRWIYKYANKTGTYAEWQQIGSTTNLNAGEGFTMKGPNPSTATPISNTQNYTFKGIPNNGTISLLVGANNEYLVANPYPSAIDADLFITDNSTSLLDGTLYFWEQFNVTNHVLADYQGGYATYTLGSGVPAAAYPGLGGGTASKTPQRYIPVAQGFFTQSDTGGGSIVFNNDQRIFVTEASGNSIFMKQNNDKSKVVAVKNSDVRPKYRLGFEAPQMGHRQILLTIDQNTTDGIDWGYEGEMNGVLADDMFWDLNNNKKYVIQALPDANIDREVPLGIVMGKAGLAKIQIDALENVDENVEVYIKDALLGKTTQINNQPFEINLDAGTYTNRFALVFAPQNALDLEDDILAQGLLVFMNNDTSEIEIRNTIQAELLSVKLFNSLGQLQGEWTKNLEAQTIYLPVNSKATGMYIIQLNTTTGTISKKVIIE